MFSWLMVLSMFEILQGLSTLGGEEIMSHVIVKFTGSLREYAPDGTDASFRVEWPEDRPVEDLLKTTGVPMAMVQVVMVNNRAVPPGAAVAPGDRVCVFPVEYAFFADWVHMRFNR